MSFPFMRSGHRIVALLGLAFTAAAPCAAQKTYTKIFTAPPAAVTVFAYDDIIRLTGGSPTFNRPALDPPGALTTLSQKGTNVAYATGNFTVTVDGNYRIVCDSISPIAWDNCVYVYKTSFSAASPLTNCIAGNNAAFGTGHSGFAGLHLTPGVYTLVTTAYYNTVAGTFSASVASATGAVNLTFSATTTNAPTWNRPNASLSSLSSGATAAPYYAYPFTAPRSGTYHFLSECTNPTDWDDFTFLYQGSFAASSPLANLLAGNDDLNGIKSSGFSYSLTAGTQYVFITTSAINQSYGDFTGYITASGSATPLYAANGQTTAPTATYSTFNRPQVSGSAFPKSLDGDADSVYYKTHPFTVTTSGLYNFKSVCATPTIWQNVMVLYRDSFDPTAPLTNALFAVGGNNPTTEVVENVPLTAGTSYIWVTTSFLDGEGGAFQNTLYTGGQAFPPTIPDNSGAGLPLTIRVADNYSVAGLNKVVIMGLQHTSSGNLLATLTHNGVRIELFDRIGAATDGAFGSSAAFNGDYTFTATGADLGVAAQSATISPAVSYAPFLNGTAGQSSQLTGDFTAFNGLSAAGDWTLIVSDRTAQTIGSYSGFSLTLAPVASVSGTLILDSVYIYAPAQTLTFTCRPTSGGAALVTTASVFPDGKFTITGLPLQAYTLHIKGNRYLAVNVPVDFSAGSVSGLSATLQGGDANNDNHCDPTDFGLIVGAYDSAANVPGSGYDPAIDLDFDGFIGATDFAIIVGNYGAVGAL